MEDGDDLVAVVAWQDIVRVDLEGIWPQGSVLLGRLAYRLSA